MLVLSQLWSSKEPACPVTDLSSSHNRHRMCLFVISMICSSRSVLSKATYYRRLKRFTSDARQRLFTSLQSPASVHVHWLDNYARFLARQRLRLNKDSYSKLLWTAHGIKVWPNELPLDFSYVISDGRPTPAMPPLAFFLSDNNFNRLVEDLLKVPFHIYPFAISTQRQVRRIPVKPSAITPAEEVHLRKSYDGLLYFEPYDIYSSNIQAYRGLITSLAACSAIDGFGTAGEIRPGHYSCILLDVSTFWMAFRLLYSFTGLIPILHDVFVFLGPFHIYMYSYVAAWNLFRSSYLAGAFFALFPDQSIYFRPSLTKSSTFFTWLRVSYPFFRQQLHFTLNTLKHLSLLYDVQRTVLLRRRQVIPPNYLRERYVRLHNLFYLFEFVLPVITDFGCAIKLGNYQLFKTTLLRMTRFILSLRDPGVPQYQRTILILLSLLNYWEDKKLPIVEMLRMNCTFLSEETGEVALSHLTRILPQNLRAELEQTRSSWTQVKIRFNALQSDSKSEKKHRFIRKLFFISHYTKQHMSSYNRFSVF